MAVIWSSHFAYLNFDDWDLPRLGQTSVQRIVPGKGADGGNALGCARYFSAQATSCIKTLGPSGYYAPKHPPAPSLVPLSALTIRLSTAYFLQPTIDPAQLGAIGFAFLRCYPRPDLDPAFSYFFALFWSPANPLAPWNPDGSSPSWTPRLLIQTDAHLTTQPEYVAGGFPSHWYIGDYSSAVLNPFPFDGRQHAIQWGITFPDASHITCRVAVDNVVVLTGTSALQPPSVAFNHIDDVLLEAPRIPDCQGSNPSWANALIDPLYPGILVTGQCYTAIEVDNTDTLSPTYAPTNAPPMTETFCYDRPVITSFTGDLVAQTLTVVGLDFCYTSGQFYITIQGPEASDVYFSMTTLSATLIVCAIDPSTPLVEGGTYCVTIHNPCDNGFTLDPISVTL